jgi:hypothetical protein
MFFQTAVWFFFFLGKVIDNLLVSIVIGVAALASVVMSFRMMRRHGRVQKAKVEEEYQRFLEKRKNQTARQTPR